jgi:hypothetical protein
MMLTQMARKYDGVAKPGAAYDTEINYDNEHRNAEHNRESQTEETPASWDAMAWRC